MVMALSRENGARPVDKFVAGVRLFDHVGDIGLHLKVGAEIQLLTIRNEKQNEPSEKESARCNEQERWTLCPVEVPTHQHHDHKIEGRPAPPHQNGAAKPGRAKDNSHDDSRHSRPTL